MLLNFFLFGNENRGNFIGTVEGCWRDSIPRGNSSACSLRTDCKAAACRPLEQVAGGEREQDGVAVEHAAEGRLQAVERQRWAGMGDGSGREREVRGDITAKR